MLSPTHLLRIYESTILYQMRVSFFPRWVMRLWIWAGLRWPCFLAVMAASISPALIPSNALAICALVSFFESRR